MNKVTIDRALIEQAVESMRLCVRESGFPETMQKEIDAMEKVLAEPAVESDDEPYECPVCGDLDPSTSCGSPTCGLIAPPAEPAPVPLLSDEEILQLTPLWFKKYTDGVLLGHARAIEQLVRRKAGL